MSEKLRALCYLLLASAATLLVVLAFWPSRVTPSIDDPMPVRDTPAQIHLPDGQPQHSVGQSIVMRDP
ncbi:MAG: hypothetical protein BIFFINMI_03548 [Phycisphaerae bacterium]|nr:hypothetical protein [Phycisphaerae bacterium]